MFFIQKITEKGNILREAVVRKRRNHRVPLVSFEEYVSIFQVRKTFSFFLEIGKEKLFGDLGL